MGIVEGLGLTEMGLTTMFDRRVIPPYGLQGGGAGAPFSATLVRASGEESILPGKTHVRLGPGDRVILESSGGGGYGRGGDDIDVFFKQFQTKQPVMIRRTLLVPDAEPLVIGIECLFVHGELAALRFRRPTREAWILPYYAQFLANCNPAGFHRGCFPCPNTFRRTSFCHWTKPENSR